MGYGKYKNVVTQLTFERMLAPNGPVIGHIVRPSDGGPVESILFVQCAGSRDLNRNVYCSSGICCMTSIKNSKLVKGEHPDMDVTIAYIDIRASGKGYEQYYGASRKSGVKYIRSKVSEMREDPKTGKLLVVLEDSLGPDKSIREYAFDLVVLSTTMMPSKSAKDINSVLKLSLSPDNFLKEFHPRLNTVDSQIPGIALSGACQGPKSIAETIMQAKGAASSIGKLLSNGVYTMELIRAINDPDKCAQCNMCVEVCPYEALSIVDEKGVRVDEILCRGCGLCAAVCPSSAITVRSYRDEQFNLELDAFFAEIEENATKELS